eukprot:159794-Amphidinium_carterae.1
MLQQDTNDCGESSNECSHFQTARQQRPYDKYLHNIKWWKEAHEELCSVTWPSEEADMKVPQRHELQWIHADAALQLQPPSCTAINVD